MGSPPVLPLPSHLDHSGLLLSPLNVTYFPPVSLLLFFPFFLVFALRSPITAFATNNGGLGYYKTSREIVVCFLKGALHYLLVTHIIILCLIFVLLFYT